MWRTRLAPERSTAVVHLAVERSTAVAHLDPKRRTAVAHLDPVYDAAGFDVRRIAPGVPTAGVRDAEDVPAPMEPALFSERRAALAQLRTHLDERVAGFLRRCS